MLEAVGATSAFASVRMNQPSSRQRHQARQASTVTFSQRDGLHGRRGGYSQGQHCLAGPWDSCCAKSAQSGCVELFSLNPLNRFPCVAGDVLYTQHSHPDSHRPPPNPVATYHSWGVAWHDTLLSRSFYSRVVEYSRRLLYPRVPYSVPCFFRSFDDPFVL